MVIGSHAASVGASEAGLLWARDPSLWSLGLSIVDHASPVDPETSCATRPWSVWAATSD